MRAGFDIALLLLRLGFGGLMIINHGLGKFNKLMAGGEISFSDPLGIGASNSLTLAVFSEVFCAGLLIIGLLTRWVSIPLVITMLVAIFMVHISDPFPKMEKAILFLIPFLILMINGGGRYSLDYLIFNR